MSTGRLVALAFLPASLGALASGCGGSGSPAVANLGATTTSTGTTSSGTNRPSRAALVTCLRAHRLQATLGSAATAGGATVSIFGVVVPGANPSSPQFQAALNACRDELPDGGPPTLTPAQQAAAAKAMLRFAACMRSRGVPDFPNPNSKGFFPPGSIQNIDPGSPQVTRAFRSCVSLEPKVGPRLQLG